MDATINDVRLLAYNDAVASREGRDAVARC